MLLKLLPLLLKLVAVTATEAESTRATAIGGGVVSASSSAAAAAGVAVFPPQALIGHLETNAAHRQFQSQDLLANDVIVRVSQDKKS